MNTPDHPVYAMSNMEALRQILDNLIDNAIKYTPEGGHVEVSLQVQGGKPLFSVADSGVGIAEDEQERVFERFYRVDKARSREVGGTGLGLSIVKHLARVIGAELSLQSQLGTGSTFTLSIPGLNAAEKPANPAGVLTNS
jgi:two-component system phosphate regulon sensor histidine kinase PhoR